MNRPFGLTPDGARTKFFPLIKSFRDCQKEAVDRMWQGESALVLMPTGMGKSLIYQLPVFASGGIGIIISPLIALMQQQAALLEKAGATVLSLGGADAADAQRALRDFPWSAGAGFLFVSPERAETDGYLEYLLRRNREHVTLVAIDEAHCISQWGARSRPAYLRLRKAIRHYCPNATFLGLTATGAKCNSTHIPHDTNTQTHRHIHTHSP